MLKRVFLVRCFSLRLPRRGRSSIRTVLGTIHDSSGGVLPGASVTLHGLETGAGKPCAPLTIAVRTGFRTSALVSMP